jgi:iron complex outermembrane receptor protein
MKPSKVKSRYFISSIALLAATLYTPMAWAQDAAEAPLAPDQAAAGEIVVTAQKRQESVNKVGMSISAFSGDALVKAGIVNTEHQRCVWRSGLHGSRHRP